MYSPLAPHIFSKSFKIILQIPEGIKRRSSPDIWPLCQMLLNSRAEATTARNRSCWVFERYCNLKIPAAQAPESIFMAYVMQVRWLQMSFPLRNWWTVGSRQYEATLAWHQEVRSQALQQPANLGTSNFRDENYLWNLVKLHLDL